jgi:hypothetical protein
MTPIGCEPETNATRQAQRLWASRVLSLPDWSWSRPCRGHWTDEALVLTSVLTRQLRLAVEVAKRVDRPDLMPIRRQAPIRGNLPR